MRVKESWNRMPVWALQQENWADALLHCWCSYVWSSVPFIFPTPVSGDQREKLLSVQCSCLRLFLRSTLRSQLLVSRFKSFKNVEKNVGVFVNLRNLSLTQSLCNRSCFNQWLRNSLAWTCIWQDEQQSRRLVPSSPMWELVGGGSELQAPTLKHISGISGRVRLPWRGKGEKHKPEEVASFDGYGGVREKKDSD